ncbi:YraN family protein [Lutibacter sp.]|uniref:YraN family protein n=1 Tax=Lutibacter sp. TaxID=1925666 RepID=UPI0035648FD0
MATHNELGNKGEEIAIDFLQKNNYKILETNWRFKKAEVDIIALKKGVLAVVEVKTRSSNYFGDPQDFVNQKKIQLLVEAINEYVISKNLDVEVRFDIIAILKNQDKFEVNHLKDAFFYF